MKKLIIILLCFIIASCEKRNFDNLEDRDTPNYFSNMLYDPNSQVLFFQNQESFSNFMSELIKLPLSEIYTNSTLNDIYSLSKFNFDKNISNLNNLKINTKDLNPDSEDEIVYDPYFAAVLNKNREINIENIIYKIVKDGVLAY